VARRLLQDGLLPRDDMGKVILVVVKKLIHSRGVIFQRLKLMNIMFDRWAIAGSLHKQALVMEHCPQSNGI
jgi:hypothetical protein